MRHFLELCYQSIVEYEISNSNIKTPEGFPIISIGQQADAAKYTSKVEVERICGLGPYGPQLEKVILRLGKIFKLKQLVKSQSEPEIIHFSIKVSNINDLDKPIKTLLKQAQLWSLLFNLSGSTKDKSRNSLNSYEWLLSPILSPFFTITYRKIRKLEFSVSEIKDIFTATDDEFEKLYKNFGLKWNSDIGSDVDSDTNPPSLFGDEI